ncbi:MAG: disulfide bond formation protein B [Alphaproteobacteria bacterium]|nr:disulfide bond formation protein B [Alphaproteobacteria bacterium]
MQVLLHPAVLATGSLTALAAAFAFQHLGGLEPCSLCIWQRWPHVATALFAVLSLGLRQPGAAVALGMAGLAALAGTGLAGFHIGVEQHWWPGLAACEGGSSAKTVAELREHLLNAASTRCDEVAWSFLGLSMAAWNGLLSLALLGLAAGALKRAIQASGDKTP